MLDATDGPELLGDPTRRVVTLVPLAAPATSTSLIGRLREGCGTDSPGHIHCTISNRAPPNLGNLTARSLKEHFPHDGRISSHLTRRLRHVKHPWRDRCPRIWCSLCSVDMTEACQVGWILIY